MNSHKLNRWLTLAANIGVIAGIILLAVELQQNNELLAAQQRFNRLSLATGTATLIAENSALAQAVTNVRDGASSLATVEQTQLDSLAWRSILNQQWTFSELPRDEMPVEQWRSNLNYPFWRDVWAKRKGQLNPEFVDYVEENVFNDR